MATATALTLDEFLAQEETKPYREYLRGEVWEKPMPTAFHGLLVALLARLLGNYLAETKEGTVVTEVRHANRVEDRAYLPDVEVSVTPGVYRQRRGAIYAQPDIAIEVLSPDDQAGRVNDKVQFYLRTGVRLVWLVDPEGESVTVYRPDAPSRQFRAPEVIDAQPVLSAFELDLTELFAVLHED